MFLDNADSNNMCTARSAVYFEFATENRQTLWMCIQGFILVKKLKLLN